MTNFLACTAGSSTSNLAVSYIYQFHKMEGKDQEIYNKVLFRTASLFELKNGLSERNISYNASDSYYLLTLKLRVVILRANDVQNEVRKSMEEEIEVIVASQRKTPGLRYECSVPGCKFHCLNYSNYLKHLSFLHQNSGSRLVCQYRNKCNRDFQTVQMLKTHFLNSHKNQWRSSLAIRQNQLIEELTSLRCMKNSCGNQISGGIVELKKHLYKHTNKKEEVQCPFCLYLTNNTGTLKQHMSRKHKIQTINELNQGIACDIDPILNEESTVEVPTDVENDLSEDVSSDDDDPEEDENVDDEIVFVKALSIVFNSWMNVANIPWSTVNDIVAQVFNTYDKGVEFTKTKIKKILVDDGIDDESVIKLISKLDEVDPFKAAEDQLRRERQRLKFLRDSFPYAEPVTVQLNSKTEKIKETYQYVPLKESLKILLEDDTYIKQRRDDPYFHEEGIIKDVRDGSVLRQNSFFRMNPSAIPILLFQDELEVANPLGAGKVKHKINCTYYTLLTIQPQLRTKVQSIQLVSLVSSRHWKAHGNQACNQRLVKDLLGLENEGLVINKPVTMTVKAGLAYIVGDNLGAHSLAELGTNFSSGYICRWCKATYNDTCRDGKSYSGCEDDYCPEEWTVEEYDKNAASANENEDVDTFGVKGSCVFNILSSFHCIRQMPPCIGHDLFEGILSKDLQFYLNYLINIEKLMDPETFNKSIRTFQLSERDAKNRPKDFKKRDKNSKYEGNAGSLRVLSRIVTMILTSVLDESDVGPLIIKLQEMSELITAPQLTVDEIDDVLGVTIREYLDLRVQAVEDLGMTTIKPKHHFASHYSRLYRENGPLIQLWAMRMESKHCFLKNVVKTSKNFKNPPKTCALRHQLAQISFGFDGLFPEKLEIPENAPYKKDLIQITFEKSVNDFLKNIPNRAVVPKKVKIWGTNYEPGMLIVLRKDEFGELTVGLLKGIAVVDGKVLFGCETFLSSQSKHNYYLALKKIKDLEIWDSEEIVDHHPLTRIGTATNFAFSLHHYVSWKT